jgi:hypothetical protein
MSVRVGPQSCGGATMGVPLTVVISTSAIAGCPELVFLSLIQIMFIEIEVEALRRKASCHTETAGSLRHTLPHRHNQWQQP